ncbi:MAG: hypothetical protein JSV84_05100 [Gemmatimonadota bacterium]|nr:MAG: hypothetical protein JSV84_05100 [Gemmatimonadota bacterium]
MTSERGAPASFLLRNSKGYPDFVMTMLVAVTLALFVVILCWMALNLVGLHSISATPASQAGTGDIEGSVVSAGGSVQLLNSFNENARLIVLGLCSSVFSLAGAYYLRRRSHDIHYESWQKTKVELGLQDAGARIPSGYVSPVRSTLTHANYDDEEEDI